MATYRLKRKNFGFIGAGMQGVGDALKNTAGGVLEGAGKVATSGIGKFAGGVAGAKIGASLGGIPGAVLGYVAGKALTKGAGEGLKDAGQDLRT